MLNKKGQGISISTIIIAIISLVVLVVLILIFTGYFGGFSGAVGAKTFCSSSSDEYTRLSSDEQKAAKVVSPVSYVVPEDSCSFTQRRLGTFGDVGPGKVCCKTSSTGGAQAPTTTTTATTGSGFTDTRTANRFTLGQ